MRLRSLALTNYRQFNSIELDFEDDLTVLVSPNGGGKTAVLDACAAALRPWHAALQGERAPSGFLSTDIRRTRSPDGAMVLQHPVALEVEGTFDAKPLTWGTTLKREGGRATRFGDLGPAASARLDQLAAYADRRHASPPSFPVLAYYGTGRLWRTGRLSKARRREATRFDRQVAAYDQSLEPSSTYEHFALWFEAIVREAQNVRAGRPSPHRPAERLAGVRHATDQVLARCGWHDLDWDFVANEVVAEHPVQGRLPVALLSDGIRNLIALVADLAHRCVRLNPHHGSGAPQQTEGVVLIDEVDMHLHPGWQQTVLLDLRAAFPKVQFIVSTHSPQVLSTVAARSLRVLTVAGAGEAPGQPTIARTRFQTRGATSADVLASVMGVDPVPEVDERIKILDYRRRIEDGTHDTPQARALRAELEQHFGAHHPEILDCDRLIRFQALRLKVRPPDPPR